ncbi:hypothetical protein CA51_36690 [Rosistilla oblonga]|uniref:hypothetical protein n=1 Tax=Rosistilla oblonga TaxID=2527990 RepID=UPI0011899FE2|nr:hypothetical protein [Rosistilla oblonga]QDV13778.1 hypothetical protein CA51_36690 [Rosistilla oblonga]
MDNAIHLMGEHATTCADFSVRAQVQSTPTDPTDPLMGRVSLTAEGPNDDGNVCLQANGRVTSQVDECRIDVLSDGIVVDSGNTGNIGLRAGAAPCMQQVDLEGNGGSIVLENGQIDGSPKIDIGEDSITLSVGTNKITISATGIKVEGLEITIEGTTSAEMKAPSVSVDASADATIKGAASTEVSSSGSMVVKGTASTEVSASGTMTLKGAMVMIN